jgi:hypothetical protein
MQYSETSFCTARGYMIVGVATWSGVVLSGY